MRSVSEIIKELFALDGVWFVLTRRLNQDPIEVSSCNLL